MLKHNWTTFLKARLNCSLPGDYPFYFDEIQGMAYIPEEKMVYATFTTPRYFTQGLRISLRVSHERSEGCFVVPTHLDPFITGFLHASCFTLFSQAQNYTELPNSKRVILSSFLHNYLISRRT